MSKQKTIERIAREILNLETPELNNPNTQMLQINNVWSISCALEAAYDAGVEAGKARVP